MEFCQIQMNYLDWTLQGAEQKVQMLQKRGLSVWVMEPVRGGALCKVSDEAAAKMQAAAPGRSAAAWALQWQIGKPSTVVLTGSSSMEQLRENVALFEEGQALSAREDELLMGVAEGMKDSVPCTACRYCCSSCPLELDIPYLLELANEVRVAPSFNVGMRIDALPQDKRPAECLACGACSAMCPQNIDIPSVLAQMVEVMAPVPHWDDLCKARYEAAQKLRAEKEGK